MTIVIASKNPTKVNAVKEVFINQLVHAKDIPSHVSNQPLSDQETLTGALIRARQAVKVDEAIIGIGLEGGVMEIENNMYLCNWGALVDRNGAEFIASGARIPLPEEIISTLKEGKELGDVMDFYAQKKNVRKKQGAIGILTNDLVSRKDMFIHVLELLNGQYSLYLKNKGE
ncbi:DUF84 family protein [Paraliobacillus zengyii]|uniref:DUF84 family protein n=1 Tax=Paraliobacillus zengyii TaxID=2213194 RepID=UPI000DD3B1E4|nr:DUF84 family protein [Paraliobacillus zengyii]